MTKATTNRPKLTRIFWTDEQRAAVYDAVGSLWTTRPRKEAFATAQVLANIPSDKRRLLADKDTKDLTARYGKPMFVPHAGRRLGTKNKPKVKPLEVAAPTPQTIELPPHDRVHALNLPRSDVQAMVDTMMENAAPPACDACAEPSLSPVAPPEKVSTYEAIGLAVSIFVDSVGDMLGDSLAKSFLRALRDPTLAQTLAELLRPSAPASEPVAADLAPAASQPEATDPEPRHDPSPDEPEEHRERLPRILVAAVERNEIEILKRHYHGRASLRFWTKDQSGHQLRNSVQGVDASVSWKKAIGHSSSEILKSHTPGKNYFLSPGGVTAMKRTIDKALHIVSLERAGKIAENATP